MLGELSDIVQIRAPGMLRVVPDLQVFPHALAEWGHGLAPRGHTSTPSRHKGEHGGVTRVSHHPRRSHCGADSGPRRDAGQEGGDGQTGGPYYPNAVSGFVQMLLSEVAGVSTLAPPLMRLAYDQSPTAMALKSRSALKASRHRIIC